MAVDLHSGTDSEGTSKPWWETLEGMKSPTNIDTLRSQLIHPGEYGVSHWYESSASDEFSEGPFASGQLSVWSQSEYSVPDTSHIKTATVREGLQEPTSHTVGADDDTSTVALSKHASQLTISQDLNNNIADILYTPMTGTSSVYSRPDDLPPRVHDAIGAYMKGTVKETYVESFIMGNEKERELNSSKSAQPWSIDVSCDSGVTLLSPRSPPKRAREYEADYLETQSMAASLHQPSIEKLPITLEKPLPELPKPQKLPRSAPPPNRSQTASCPPPISIPPPVPLRNPYRLSPKSQATRSLLPQPVKSHIHRKRSVQALILTPELPPITRPNLEPLSAIGAPSTPRTPRRGLTYEEALMVPWVENNPNRQALPPVCESLAHQNQDSIASAKSFFSASLPIPPPSVYLYSSRASSPTLGLSPPKIHSAPMPIHSTSRHSSLERISTPSLPDFDDSDPPWLRKKPRFGDDGPRRRWIGYEDDDRETSDAVPSWNRFYRKSDKILGLNSLPHSKSMVIDRGRPPNMARQRTFPTKSISHLPLRKRTLHFDKEALPELPLNIQKSSSPLFSPSSEKSPGTAIVTPNSIFSASDTAAPSSTNTSPSTNVFSPGVHPAMRIKKKTSSMLTIGSHDTNLSQHEEPPVDFIIPTLYGKRKTSDARAGESSGNKSKEMGFFKKLLKHRASKDLKSRESKRTFKPGKNWKSEISDPSLERR